MVEQLASLAVRWRRPLAIGAVVELITLGGTVGGYHHLVSRPFDPLALALLVVAAGATAFVERWPAPAFAGCLVCTAAYIGLGYQLDSPYFLALAVTGYLAGSDGARLRQGAFAVATVVLVTAASLLRPGPGSGWMVGMDTVVIAVVAMAAGQVAGELRAASRRRALEAHEEEARRRVTEERLRIARELHDVVSHSIAMINVQAGVAVHVMDEQPAQAREALREIKAASRDALRDLRGILGLLRQMDEPEPRTPPVGLAQLPDLLDNVRGAGVRVTVEQAIDGMPLPVSVDLTAYRVVQEALTNVVRHAPGAAARVRLRRCTTEMVVEVEDDGGRPGHGDHQGAGHGLIGMRERVQAAGGTIQAGPRPRGGFAVRARMPLPEEETA